MKRMNILIISGISAVVLFIILTVAQNRLIQTENTQAVFVSNVDVLRDTEIMKSDYSKVYVPASLVINTKAVTNINDLEGKHARDSINKGQIIFKQDIATKDELKLIDVQDGLERIAIKLKAPDNAVSYQVKPKDRIHLYFTGKQSVIQSNLKKNESEKNDNSIQTLKIIEDTEILGIYDEMGRSYENAEFTKLDTILIAVSPKDAEIINNLRNQGTFDITR